jgi:hypothetical protein
MGRWAVSRVGSLSTALLTLLVLAACSAPAAPSSSALATAPSTLPASPPSAAPSAITEAQSIAAVQAFAPQASGLHVSGTDTFSMGPAYLVESVGLTATVDQATGVVTSIIFNGAMPTAATVVLKPADALAAAAAFLAQRGVDVTGLTPTVTLLDHGDTQEYQIVYMAQANGVQLPTRVNLSVNPTSGAVYGFLQFRQSVGPIPSPKLTLDDAVAAAKVEENDPGLKITSSTMAVVKDASGAQELVYQLEATRSDGFYVMLNVDALSGSVAVMGRG